MSGSPMGLVLCRQSRPMACQGAVSRSIQPSQRRACSRLSPHMSSLGCSEPQTAGRSGRPKIMQRSSSSSWMQRTPAGLPPGIPGIGELMEGAMQQAAHRSRQFMPILCACACPSAVTYPQPPGKIQGLPAPLFGTFFGKSTRLHPMLYPKEFDVIVVGGGHAGTEAALAAARMGCTTLLLTHNIETLGQMSCNPSIGGIGKGHLVKEVDALGGAMAAATDESGIQFRILNGSKGPAVRATRAQADRVLYKAAIRHRLENQPNLWLFQQAVDDLMVEGDRVVGAVTQMGLQFRARAVVLTAGTFLDGRIHVGLENYSAGRAGDPPAVSLSARLK
eukprot:Opistho-2@11425